LFAVGAAAVSTLSVAGEVEADEVTVVDGPCVDGRSLDPRGDAAVDVEFVSLTLDCPTDRWVFGMAALAGPVVGQIEHVEIWFDTDANPRNGCEGFERLIRDGSAYRRSSCTAEARTGDVQFVRTSPSGVELRWASSVIGSPRQTIRYRAIIRGAGGSVDTVPNKGAVEFWGVDGRTMPPLPPPTDRSVSNGRCDIPQHPDLIRPSLVRLYYAYFHRDALDDPAGLAYWERQYGTGASCLTEVSEYFARSAEFIGTYGNLTDAAFVHRVYVNVLGREPDGAGSAYWSNQLATGRVRRGTMMVGFSESPEFRSISGMP
jgi:hypothetical protein